MRVKVACINWTYPDAPHAVSYAVLEDGGAAAEVFHATWAEAWSRAVRLAEHLANVSEVDDRD